MPKKAVVINDFEQPESCWDCPILKTTVDGFVYCGLIGERNGRIKEYEHGFIRKDCKLETLTFSPNYASYEVVAEDC